MLSCQRDFRLRLGAGLADWLYRRCGGARDAADLPSETRDALHIRAIELAIQPADTGTEAEPTDVPRM
jgi:hypothetical protein